MGLLVSFQTGDVLLKAHCGTLKGIQRQEMELKCKHVFTSIKSLKINNYCVFVY